jgi:hypothetical protein
MLGSGTKKQDMVDSESQSVLRKEEPFMVTITLHGCVAKTHEEA